MSADPIIYCLENLTDYRQFERLCTDVMSQSGFPDIELLGGSNDGGRDAIHVSRQNPADITLFAYSVRVDWQNKLLNEDCKRIQEEKHQLKRLVFACTSGIPSTQNAAVKQKVLDTFGWTLELFDLERLRTRLAGELRHLLAQHSAIFSPPFFPTRGGLSLSECRDTLIIDHHVSDHALATWLARRLQLCGHRVWCYGTAPLASEDADGSIRLLISQRASRFLPILSAASIADIDFVGRCAVTAGIEGLVLPCFSGAIDRTKLPSKVQELAGTDFTCGWAVGLKGVTEALEAHGIRPALTGDQGKIIALRSYVPQPVTKESPERVYANTFSVTVPDAILVCELAQEMSDADKATLRRSWAFVEADARTLLAFDNPPDSVPLAESPRLASYDWRYYRYGHNKRSTDVVKELIRRSLEVACVAAGLQWCDDRRKFYFPVGARQQRFLAYTHVDGRRTRTAATGEMRYGRGDRAAPFLYQLCPTFRVGYDEAGGWWVTMRIYVRITDTAGIPHRKKAIAHRRKKVTKAWWNKQWFARTLAVMQALANGGTAIAVGSGSGRLSVSTHPLGWDCPVAIDYEAVEKIGDFQEEMASLRYVDDESDADDEEAGDE
jgi:hypothetical protein